MEKTNYENDKYDLNNLLYIYDDYDFIFDEYEDRYFYGDYYFDEEEFIEEKSIPRCQIRKKILSLTKNERSNNWFLKCFLV